MSEIWMDTFYCEDTESPGFCIVQCTLCKLRATTKGGEVQQRTDAEKLKAIYDKRNKPKLRPTSRRI